MNVAGYFKKVRIDIYEKRFVPSLIEMTCPLMPFVEISGIGNVEVTHELLKVGLGCPCDNMKVVCHEHEGMKPDIVYFYGTCKKFKEFVSIVVGKEDILFTITPAGHMVTGIGVLNAKGPTHKYMIQGKRRKCQ